MRFGIYICNNGGHRLGSFLIYCFINLYKICINFSDFGKKCTCDGQNIQYFAIYLRGVCASIFGET